VTTWLVVALHELAHGLTCRRFGGAATEMGVLWRFPLLTPYCKTDDMVLFPRQRQRVYTAFAGTFVNLVFLVPFAVAWRLTDPGTHAHALAASLLLFGSLTVLLNLTPVLRLDGYFMLNHALGMADLRTGTYRFWTTLLRRRRPAYQRPADRWAYLVYGLVTAVLCVAVLAAVVGSWYWNLSRWTGPVAAVTVLVAEAVVVVAVLVVVRRRRARAAAASPPPAS
jgi:hypothetical protein